MLITAPVSETPRGVIMKVSQALAMNMIAVPTMLRPSPEAEVDERMNFPQP